MRALITLILSMNWIWVRKVHQSHRTTRQISWERKSSLFGTTYRSSEFEIEMLEEAPCARTHCYKLCVSPNSRTKTATLFSRIHCERHIFNPWACAKASGRHFEHLIWLYFSAVCVTKVGFCCVMFMSTVVLLGVFSAWITIKYHASI